jgi:hypothetical protein
MRVREDLVLYEADYEHLKSVSTSRKQQDSFCRWQCMWLVEVGSHVLEKRKASRAMTGEMEWRWMGSGHAGEWSSVCYSLSVGSIGWLEMMNVFSVLQYVHNASTSSKTF